MSFLPPYQFTVTNTGREGFFIPAVKIPVVYLQLRFHLGALTEKPGEWGVADAMTEMFEEGCGHYDSFTFVDELEKRGSYISFSCGYDSIFVYIASLKEYFAETFDLLRTALYSPHFSEELFKIKRGRIFSGMQRQLAQPGMLTNIAAMKAVYPAENRYSVLTGGSLFNIKSVTLGQVKDFHAQEFLNSKVSFVCSGDLTESELFAQLNKLEHPGVAADRFAVPKDPERKKVKTSIVSLPNSPQTVINFSSVASGRLQKNHYARMIMNYIFGGNFNSRLNEAIREKGGLSYGASSAFSYSLAGGLFEIDTSVETEHTAKAVKIILDEIKTFSSNLKNEEVEKAKTAYINRIPLRFETPNQYIAYFSSVLRLGIPFDLIGRDIEKVSALTHQDILEAFTEEVNGNELQITLCGNLNAVAFSEPETVHTGDVELIEKETLM